MTTPITKPKKKNPALRTRVPLTPPGNRARATLGFTAAAAEGRFALPVCRDCGAVQYPPREVCNSCLSDNLAWRDQPSGGELISHTTVRHSMENFYLQRMPWRLGIVRLDTGVSVIANVHGDVPPPPVRVTIGARLDKAGQGVLVAFPEKETANMADDRQLREMTCDPKFRKVFVTDGKTAVGQALVRAVVAAGASLVWVGQPEPWIPSPGLEELRKIPEVVIMPMDVTDSVSVKRVGGEIGFKVDILINNAEYHRNFGIAARHGVEVARNEMDVNYFGLLRLGQEFGPVMRSRGADGQNSATAWVNILSIFALANYPAHGTFAASKAAAHSLAQCLRAEMHGSGVRVMNVFPGPIDDEWNQTLRPPKISPTALANAVVKALKDGVEDVYPGEFAQDWLARWRDNPKVLEREQVG